MRIWYPIDNCPPGDKCAFEIGANTSDFIHAVHLCPFHAAQQFSKTHRQIHGEILAFCVEREQARAMAKAELGLAKNHPGVWFRIENDGTFTLGVNQRGVQMPEWPSEPTKLADMRAKINSKIKLHGAANA